ncbi:FAD-binding oxidoreductase [Caenimonas soli]|uniref:FAD-binding oxidoreductase n=1 Tax=Caenimonas soli TaxID=2735555 RepID=UPI001555E6EC|nr:FAD-binding oxidoreductase [Caenimonas soli]NPC59363.1 FAD-binding oxidoreductase [Caenimonas soli]
MTSAAFLDALRNIVGDAGLLHDEADAAAYVTGARYGAGRARCVVRPATSREVSRVVALCVRQRVALVPQGANTGLVGASTPDGSGAQVILSLNRLRGRCDVDVVNRTVTVDAGVLLHELNDALEPHGLCFPVDLGANPSIGGMVAANTGGTRLIRYGDVRHNLLAVEAVMLEPAGELVRFGKPLRKDNTGFDLKQLFVGTSGVAGVITQVTLEVHPRPKQSATALVVPVSDEAVMQLLRELESELGDFLSAFEGMSADAMCAAIDHVPSLRNPFNGGMPDFAILIELESCSSAVATGLDLQQVLNEFLEARLGKLIIDAVVGRGRELWHLRHSISEGTRSLGKPIAFDVSLPRADIMRFRREARALLTARYPHLRVADFGHIADGGMHFNLAWPHDAARGYDVDVVKRVRDELYALVVHGFAGTYSAEHGIGPHNLAWYRMFTVPLALQLSGRLQRLLDPHRLCGVVELGSTPEAM